MIDDMPDDVAARLDVLLSGQVEPLAVEATEVRQIGPERLP
jgi:hypothetical protein